MNGQALALKKQRQAVNDDQLWRAVFGTGTATKEILGELLKNPVFTLILANIAIEAAQLIKVGTDKYSWQVVDAGTPNQHHELRRVYQPLISQVHATALESIINTSAALQALAPALSVVGALK